MRLRNTMRWRALTAASLLATALAIPGSTAAVPTDAADLDAAPTRRIDTPATPSLWDQPASPAPSPVVVNAAAPAKPVEPERARSPNPLWAIPLATLTTTRDRPIFSPSRRPPPPAVVPAPVAIAPPPRPKPVKVERPQLALVGTIAGTEQSFGIFVDQTTKTALRLKIGEDYQGWRLRDVAPREVTLVHDEETAVLSLPAPDAAAAQPVTMQAENTSAITEPKRLRGARR
jgi:general secretion pathway protein N